MTHLWTAEEDAKILQLRADGLTSSVIAAAMNDERITRNSVIGRFHRLKLMGEIVPATAQTAVRSAQAIERAERRNRKPAQKPATKPVCVATYSETKELVWPKPVVVVPAHRPILSKRVTIFELDRCMCRAPLWGTHESLPIDRKFYCGAPSDGGSWCIDHHAQMFGQGTSYERKAHVLEGVAA